MCSLTGCFFQAKNQTHCVLCIELLITESNVLTRDVQPDFSTPQLYFSIFWGWGGLVVVATVLAYTCMLIHALWRRYIIVVT